jgi:uncharacterized protein YjbI with pentapeptide repeats
LQAAKLAGAGLTMADLSGADLRHTDLSRLTEAMTGPQPSTGITLAGVSYDIHTRWPVGFDPEIHGASKEE